MTSKINVTKFFQSGIYCIENQTTGTQYIGQSQNIIKRLGGHLEKLSSNHSNVGNGLLQNDWNLYGENDFQFIVLETGNHLSLKKKRLLVEKLYVKQALDNNQKLYNTIKNSTKQEINKLQLKNDVIKPCNINITQFNLPGVYVIKHNGDNKRYIGQGQSLIKRFYTDLRDLSAKTYENPYLQNVWSQYEKEKPFYFQILEYGNHLFDKKIRLEREKMYIQTYEPNTYNIPVQGFQRGVFINPDWNRVPIYRKINDQFQKFNTIREAKPKGVSMETIRAYLDDPKNTDWFYARSFARYFDSGRIELVVVDLKHVYLNNIIGAFKSGYSFKTFSRRVQEKDYWQVKYLSNLTLEEKQRIPNLKYQVKKALRLTLPLPLNLNDPLENQIFKEQSSTYSTTNENDPSFYDMSQEYCDSMYQKFEKMLQKFV